MELWIVGACDECRDEVLRGGVAVLLSKSRFAARDERIRIPGREPQRLCKILFGGRVLLKVLSRASSLVMEPKVTSPDFCRDRELRLSFCPPLLREPYGSQQ